MRRLLLLPLLLWCVSADAAEIVGTHAERMHLGGKNYRAIIHGAPIGYQDVSGRWQRIVADWSDGDVGFPQIVSRSRLRVKAAPDGMRRILPIPGDDSKYLEIGAPYVKNASGDWTKPAFTGPTRDKNKLTWTNPNATLSVIHLGHGIKLDIELLGGYIPRDSQFAFPVGISNLQRNGGQILDGSTVVMLLRSPYVYDAAQPQDVRPIVSQFVNVNGQNYILFTLPSLTGMSRPTVDPVVTLQPGAADGVDAYIQDTPSTNINNGVRNILAVGEDNTAARVYRSLIKFSLSSVPVSAKISSARLALYCSSDASSNARALRAYRLKRAWVEGTRDAADDTPATGATWIRYDTVNNWATAGGFGAADCEQTDIGYRTFAAAETLNEFKFFTLNTSKVQEWVNGTFANNGVLLKADTESDDAYGFPSSDSATASQRPYLVVDYRTRRGMMPNPVPDWRPRP